MKPDCQSTSDALATAAPKLVPAATNDIEECMRRGHPYLADTTAAIVEAVVRRAASFGSRPRIAEIGCASGLLASAVAVRLPEAELVAHEELPELAELAKRRLAGTGVRLHTSALALLEGPMDVIFSGGAHHHLPTSYLDDVRRLLGTDGVYVLGDELCPEYCDAALARRIARAEFIRVVDGHVLVNTSECERHAKDGTIPQDADRMERRRKQALWRWYRFVVDHAMRGGHYEVAIAELASARDDLVTGSSAEHKMSATIVERELALAGFQLQARRVFGPADDPALQSFHVFEFATGHAGWELAR
jgi:protein-L-isoaspartate O-methyltransferase